jgi:NADP-dependent 3-hydroxy acid dehydrogenase YdfG
MAQKDLTIVTGASRGIGRGIALRLAREGHDLMLFGRDKTALENVNQEVQAFGIKSEMFLGDAADKKFVNDSVQKILKEYGKIDHLINNAGMGILNKLVDSTLEEFKQQVDVNLYGVYNFTKAVINHMIENRKGSIINISSLAGKNAFVGGTMYGATKHALMGFTKSLMLEVREYNIRVAAICPGSVDTDFNPNRDVIPEKKNILLSEDVAETVALVLKMPIRAMVSEIDIRPTNPK